MLSNFAKLIDSDGDIFLSTPCYDSNVGAAANHVNEMTYRAFGAALEDSGFRIIGHWGTFASMRDYSADLETIRGLPEVFDRLREYYDTNYLATVFAPLFPNRARNCLWHVRHERTPNTRLFPTLMDVPKPWGSSEHWERLLP